MYVFGSLQGCEREVAESGNAESKNESLMRLSWALVHSRHPEDVNRGIAMLEGVYTSYGQLYFVIAICSLLFFILDSMLVFDNTSYLILQLPWTIQLVHCNQERNFICWLLGITEMETTQEVVNSWTDV